MSSLVAENTVYRTVIRGRLGKILGLLDVANLAESRRNPTGRHDLKRAMRLMAASTVGIHLR
jgi:hypothetical protein